jgi:DNA-binding transcriptional LysR family regulator
MRLEQLSLLIEVAKYNSISLAAEHAFITQPAVSSAISKLEDELGTVLFKRTTHGAYPTSIGEIIIDKARNILNEVAAIKQIANTSTLSGCLSVGIIPSMCDKIIPNVLSVLKNKHPNIEFTLFVEESTNILQSIQTGMVDLGIVLFTKEIQGKGIYFEELFTDEFLIYAGKNSPLYERESVSLKEALEYPFVAYNDEFAKNNGGITSILKNHGEPKVAFRFSNFELIKRVVSLGIAISFFPKFMAIDDIYLQSGEIKAIPINDINLALTVGILRSSRHSISLVEKEFVTALKSMCEIGLLKKSS